MARWIWLLVFLALTACGQNGMTTADNPPEEHEYIVTPEKEAEYRFEISRGKVQSFRFPQTEWNECREAVTGNYFGYGCVEERGMSVILKQFLADHVHSCVNAGLAAQGGGEVSELHIVHAGILGDARHAPRSLHAEQRAIDIKSLEVKLTNGVVKKFVYEKLATRPFYKAFRDCWGRVINRFNGCPLMSGNPGLTGSIGWEDKNHQRHLHTSVPYCVAGAYSSAYYRR